jgi:hypothetical protein
MSFAFVNVALFSHPVVQGTAGDAIIVFAALSHAVAQFGEHGRLPPVHGSTKAVEGMCSWLWSHEDDGSTVTTHDRIERTLQQLLEFGLVRRDGEGFITLDPKFFRFGAVDDAGLDSEAEGIH